MLIFSNVSSNEIGQPYGREVSAKGIRNIGTVNLNRYTTNRFNFALVHSGAFLGICFITSALYLK